MWQDELLDEIRSVDHEQSPHGLYGLPDKLKVGDRLHPLSRMFGGSFLDGKKRPELQVISRLGWRAGVSGSEKLNFAVSDGKSVQLEVSTHASTKIRNYGGAYRLDKVHGKGRPKDCGEWEKHMSKLPKLARWNGSPALEARLDEVAPNWRDEWGRSIHGHLLIAYVPRPNDFGKLLGVSSEPAWTERYGLQFASKQWEDVYRRGFQIGLFLWTCSRSASEESAAETSG